MAWRCRFLTARPRTDLVKNCRVHPTHWSISTQAFATWPGLPGRASRRWPWPSFCRVDGVGDVASTRQLSRRRLQLSALQGGAREKCAPAAAALWRAISPYPCNSALLRRCETLVYWAEACTGGLPASPKNRVSLAACKTLAFSQRGAPGSFRARGASCSRKRHSQIESAHTQC